MPRLPVSVRVAILCRAPGRAAVLGWPGPPWLGRDAAAAAIVTSRRVRALHSAFDSP
jgi:hypothetical protein